MTLWNETHLQLQDAMKKEIETMREILGNMKEEEHFLIHKDKAAWNYTIEARNQLFQRLTETQRHAQRLATSLQEMVLPHSTKEIRSLEEILPRDDENRPETLSLRDQILALIDRMNLQSSRNEMLFELAKYREKYPSTLPETEKKGKISLATMQDEGDNA
ncbi:MAG: hypothetical protein JSR58_01380 [Verrucomicrobia bacterium]|nr:hypothetical protein [Verrucomicrobiota bacterium]